MKDAFQITPTAIHYHCLAENGYIKGMTSLAIQPDAGMTAQLHQSAAAAESNRIFPAAALHWLNLQQLPISKIAAARQVHGKEIRYISEAGVYNHLDGFYTDQENLPLTIQTADCAAVMVGIPGVPAVGIAHAGWRGARLNIVPLLVEKMKRRWQVSGTDLRIAISPHIKKCCYEVGNEFLEYFPAGCFEVREGYFFDLEKLLLQQLSTLGIPKPHINCLALCTACANLPLYSYRKQKTRERLLNIISISHQE